MDFEIPLSDHEEKRLYVDVDLSWILQRKKFCIIVVVISNGSHIFGPSKPSSALYSLQLYCDNENIQILMLQLCILMIIPSSADLWVDSMVHILQ